VTAKIKQFKTEGELESQNSVLVQTFFSAATAQIFVVACQLMWYETKTTPLPEGHTKHSDSDQFHFHRLEIRFCQHDLGCDEERETVMAMVAANFRKRLKYTSFEVSVRL
jgi:hypothetical protein